MRQVGEGQWPRQWIPAFPPPWLISGQQADPRPCLLSLGLTPESTLSGRSSSSAGASTGVLAPNPQVHSTCARAVRLAAPQAARPQLAEWPVSDRFGSVFPSLNMAVKRREQALQDYRRLQAKVEKYEEKEKTGPVLAKLHQVPREGSSG